MTSTLRSFVTVIFTEQGARAKVLEVIALIAEYVTAGIAVELSVKPATKPITAKQRVFFHNVVLKQVSEKVWVELHDKNGVPTGQRDRRPATTWKKYFVARFLGWAVPDDDGRDWVIDRETGELRESKRAPAKELVSTETIGPERYSKLIDDVIDTCVVEHGIEFEFTDVDREAVRYVGKASRRPR